MGFRDDADQMEGNEQEKNQEKEEGEEEKEIEVGQSLVTRCNKRPLSSIERIISSRTRTATVRTSIYRN